MQLVRVYSAGTEVEALLVKQMLEEASIPVMIRAADTHSQYIDTTYRYSPLSTHDLFVAEENAENANLLVQDFVHQAETGALDPEGSDRDKSEGGPTDRLSSNLRGLQKIGVSVLLLVLTLILLNHLHAIVKTLLHSSY